MVELGFILESLGLDVAGILPPFFGDLLVANFTQMSPEFNLFCKGGEDVKPP